MSHILAARTIAYRAHALQYRKDGTTPYIVHPCRVAGLMLARSGSEEHDICAALLHDVLEDGMLDDDRPVTAAWLRTQFPDEIGKRVVELVVAVTNQYTKANHPSWNRKYRKEAEADRLGRASKGAKVLKMLDRLDNVSDLANADLDFALLYERETAQLLGQIGDADPHLADTVNRTARAAVQECRGNGGISSHKKACKTLAARQPPALVNLLPEKCHDHKPERGAFGVCKRCGAEIG